MSITFVQGQIPTPAQWNAAFAAKQPLLGFTPLNSAGGVMTGELTTAASTSASSGFNITPGTAPSSPNNGDLWTTSTGIFINLSGTTYQLATGTAGAAILNANNTFTGNNTFQGNVNFLGTLSGLTQPSLLTVPQGRITLRSGSAVMSTSVTSGSDIWYAPYNGSSIPIYNGTAMVVSQFTSSVTDTIGLHLPLNSSASWAANTLFDVFATLNGTAVTLVTGPAWTSLTARAATGTIGYYNGFLVNVGTGVMVTRTGSATTLNVAQYRATYLGTVQTNNGTAGQISFIYGIAAASGDSGSTLNVWNYYNRVLVSSNVIDTSSYTYNGGIRRADNSAGNAVNFVQGVAEESALINYNTYVNGSAGNANTGFGLDGTGAFTQFIAVSNIIQTGSSYYVAPPQQGSHFVQALEVGTAAPTAPTFGGNGTTTPRQTLSFSMRM
jgi:hypothetical protein